jgi:metal-sulfur cluster biosynthetic enzyme
MPVETITTEAIWNALEEVKDPEIPVISVVEMGLIREVSLNNEGAVVKMTPTFSGCPALHVMQRDSPPVGNRFRQCRSGAESALEQRLDHG